MKTIFTILILVIVSCTEQKIQAGQCIQRPDSPLIYKVNKIEENLFVVQNQTERKSDEEKFDRSGNWGVVNCIY